MTTTYRSLLRIVIVLSATVSLAATVSAQSIGGQRVARADSTIDEKMLVKLENNWAKAVIRRDAKALRTYVDPRWVYTDESGTMTREQGITAFTTGTDTVTEAGNEEMHIIIHNRSVAVVTGILWMRGRGPNGAFEHRYRYTDTWLREQGVWRCIASQDYLLAGGGR